MPVIPALEAAIGELQSEASPGEIGESARFYLENKLKKQRQHRLINLAEEISRQHSIQAVAWLSLAAFSQVLSVNQGPKA
jgi:hypothetical protein